MSGRIPVQIPVEFTFGPEWQKGVVVDLSQGGVRLLTRQIIKNASHIRVSFALGTKNDFQIEGEVSNVNSRELEGLGSFSLAGINFPDLSEEARKRLLDFFYDQRYYTRLFRPTKNTEFLEEQNLRKAATLLLEIEQGSGKD